MSVERQNIIGKMDERESLQAFVEGAKIAASAARELARDNEDKQWAFYANELDMLRENCVKLINQKSMSNLRTLIVANEIQDAIQKSKVN